MDRPDGPILSLTAKLEKLTHRLGRLEEEFSDATSDLRVLAEDFNGLQPVRKKRRMPVSNSALSRAADLSYVEKLRIDWRPDGGAEFWLGLSPLNLTRALAELLYALADAKCSKLDELVEWTELSQLQHRLKRISGTWHKRSALVNQIHRLRTALAGAGINPGLVQTHRDRGARLALKWQAVPAYRPTPKPAV